MAITKQQKKQILAELVENMKNSQSVFFAKNIGLSVAEAQDMRTKLRENGNSFRVAKKTLIKKAANDEMGIDIPAEILEGAAGAAFAMEDELSAIKILAKFAKDSEKIELTGGIFEGKLLSKDEVIALSKIPGREELLAKLLGSMQAPLSGFVGVGNQLIAGLARVVDGYRAQKEAA